MTEQGNLLRALLFVFWLKDRIKPEQKGPLQSQASPHNLGPYHRLSDSTRPFHWSWTVQPTLAHPNSIPCPIYILSRAGCRCRLVHTTLVSNMTTEICVAHPAFPLQHGMTGSLGDLKTWVPKILPLASYFHSEFLWGLN